VRRPSSSMVTATCSRPAVLVSRIASGRAPARHRGAGRRPPRVPSGNVLASRVASGRPRGRRWPRRTPRRLAARATPHASLGARPGARRVPRLRCRPPLTPRTPFARQDQSLLASRRVPSPGGGGGSGSESTWLAKWVPSREVPAGLEMKPLQEPNGSPPEVGLVGGSNLARLTVNGSPTTPRRNLPGAPMGPPGRGRPHLESKSPGGSERPYNGGSTVLSPLRRDRHPLPRTRRGPPRGPPVESLLGPQKSPAGRSSRRRRQRCRKRPRPRARTTSRPPWRRR